MLIKCYTCTFPKHRSARRESHKSFLISLYMLHQLVSDFLRYLLIISGAMFHKPTSGLFSLLLLFESMILTITHLSQIIQQNL